MALQLRDARRISFDHAFRIRVISHLAAKPIWLVGVAVSGIGFLLQLGALDHGSVVTVQPIVGTALIVCLAITAWSDRAPLGWRTWRAVIAVAGGVALFLTAGNTSRAGTTIVAPRPLGAATAVLLVVLGICVSEARHKHGARRAAAVGLAAGLANALVAVLVRAGADALGHGVRVAADSPYPYAAVVASGVAVILVQAIYQAGQPTLSLPIAIFTESAASVALALLVLHERPILAGTRGTGAVGGLVIAACGLAYLAKSHAAARAVRPSLTG
ncbi:MAG: hypothetical protein QOI70_215 [Microbacteriaceae bacterium]|nr:hypothetical protein [Microbacteriaceae bacterium]